MDLRLRLPIGTEQKMNHHAFTFAEEQLWAMADGSLFWPARRILVVSDLHLGKSERIARRQGMLLPPFETADTLERLQSKINDLGPRTVVCLGDSFDDDTAAQSLGESDQLWITKLQAGREWIWVAGNHDPQNVPFGGTQVREFLHGKLVMRHIAEEGAEFEISGHFHPKARVSTRKGGLSRPCFLIDERRVIMPAFGTYTGGLRCADPALQKVMSDRAVAVLIGPEPLPVPFASQK